MKRRPPISFCIAFICSGDQKSQLGTRLGIVPPESVVEAEVEPGEPVSETPVDVTPKSAWNPLEHPIQNRYGAEKKQIIMVELEDRGIEFNIKWPGAQLHQLLLDDIPKAGPDPLGTPVEATPLNEQPDPSPETPAVSNNVEEERFALWAELFEKHTPESIKEAQADMKMIVGNIPPTLDGVIALQGRLEELSPKAD